LLARAALPEGERRPVFLYIDEAAEYFDSNIRFSSQPMCFPKTPEHFKWLMTICRGEDWLLYSSDWPHATFDPFNWVFNPMISEDGRKKILRDNAKGWIKRLGV